jgi:lipopolysaccharide export system permease protein
MSPTFVRYVGRLYFAQLVLGLFAVVVVFLVADFGDRLKAYLDRPLTDVLLLYWNKGLLSVQLLGPAAMLLAAGAAISTLRQRGELVGLRALGGSRVHLYLPVGAVALAAALGLSAWDEWIAGPAGRRVDAIHKQRLGVWGDFNFFYLPRQWFRVGQHVFHVRHTGPEGLGEVSVFKLSGEFSLEERIDAATMAAAPEGGWTLSDGEVRTFLSDGTQTHAAFAELKRDFPGVEPDTFRVMLGKPEQMKFKDLLAQRELRAKVGLPSSRYDLALHNRFAYPLTGVAAALLAVALAARPRRKGHLTAALVEGLAIVGVLWLLMVAGRSAVLSEALPAAIAAWTPVGILFLAAVGVGRWSSRTV